jgi:two-component system sensor histidine kinase YesM
MCYFNKLSLKTNIDPSILEYSILKITLQPIVENSILHGILNKDDDTGTVTISGKLEDGIIVLKVEDDGAGIPPEKLKMLCSQQIDSKTGSGFGIRNINERFKLFYGEQYGLTYSSTYLAGTCAEIRFPAVKYDQ